MLAPVCTSFCLVNVGTHQRSATNPLGNTDHLYIRNGNLMASRVALIVFLLTAMGIWVLLEQPMSSFMELHPRIAQWIAHFGIQRRSR